MANAVYTLSYSDRAGDAWNVQIWSKAVNTNPAIAIKGSARPLTINVRPVTDIFEPVLVSEAIVEVISETDLYWKDFFTATRGAWILKVYRNSYLIWQGQNVTESYNEPYLGTPYTSQLKFSDLGDMDFIYYKSSATVFYAGFQSLAAIIFNCTNKLGFQLDAHEYTNCINLEGYNNASVTYKSLLCNTFLDARVFRNYEDDQETAMTCMEVLKKVLRSIGCRMVQGTGQFASVESRYHIQRIEEMIDSDALSTFKLDQSTATVNVLGLFSSDLKRNVTNAISNFATDICPVNQNQDLGMSERNNRAIYKYTTKELFRKDAELLLNHNFFLGVKTHNNTTKFPKYFQVSSDISSSNICQVVAGNTAESKSLLFRAYQQAVNHPAMAGMLAAQGTSMSTIASMATKYMRTTGTESGDTVDAGSAAMSNVQVSVLDNLRLKITGKILKGIDYSSATSLGVNNENYLTSALFHFGIKVKLLYDNGKKYTWFMNPTYPGYGQNKWTVWNGTAGTVGDNIIHRIIGTNGFSNNLYAGIKYYEDKFEITLDSAVFPENGIAAFSVFLYTPRTESVYMAPIGLAAVTLDDFSLKYVTDGDFSDEIIKNLTFYTLTDAKENEYTFDVEFGDGPADYCLSSFRYGVVSAADQYKKTSSWRKLDDATAVTAANLFCMTPGKKLLSAYQRVISGDYMGVFDCINTLNIDDGVADKKYLIMGDSWDTKATIHSLVMQEITEQNPSITVSDALTNFTGPSIPSDSGAIAGTVKSIFSSKTIGNAVIFNPPSKLMVNSIQIKYPG